MVKRPVERAIQARRPVPPIVMGAPTRSTRSRAELTLIILMRVIAVLWMLEGLRLWASVLTGPATPYLPAQLPLHVAGLVFFCILDFVAAIGLWLLSSWGTAVWLATVLGHWLALAIVPGSLADPVIVVALDLGLLVAYAILSWMIARERRQL